MFNIGRSREDINTDMYMYSSLIIFLFNVSSAL